MQPLTENAVNIPAFLSKLWKMLNDPGTDHLICWSPGGKSFCIQNQAQFWYELLPLHYKHNNMSSFVRQLNMYGFHKMSTYENGTIDADKDEIQFYHPCFQKDHPELLPLIKRKVTGSKHLSENISSTTGKSDDLLRVLDDVKQLRGRQASVDSELSAMKNDNAVLWRELAMLRQKHLKQQQIVNKLIQFLVTCVQPRRSGLGVKRLYPLMINESPEQNKKAKTSLPAQSEGPTIHELDSTDILPEELFNDDVEPLGQPENSALNNDPDKVQSPLTPHSTSTKASHQGDENPTTPAATLLDEAEAENIDPEIFWDSPDFVNVKTEDFFPQTAAIAQDEGIANENIQTSCTDIPVNEGNNDAQRVFLNPTSQDTMLSNLINGSYNTESLSGKKGSASYDKKQEKEQPALSPINPENSNMAVATRDPNLTINRLNSVEDFDQHVESTQSELDQLKDILNGYTSFDANALLGLFNDDAPEYGLSFNQNNQNSAPVDTDPLVSGSEITTYEPGSSLIDFDELFDDAVDVQDAYPSAVKEQPKDQSINTPQVVQMNEPVFPTNASVDKKQTKWAV